MQASSNTATIGLSSALPASPSVKGAMTAPATTAKPSDVGETGVAAIASRFNAAAAAAAMERRRGPANRVSSLANMFGTTIHDEDPNKYPRPASLRRPLTASTRPKAPPVKQPFLNHIGKEGFQKKSTSEVVEQSAGSVNNVAKIFDDQSVDPLNKDTSDANSTETAEESSFLIAKNLFKNAEADQLNQGESKVEASAKLIESNESTANEPAKKSSDDVSVDAVKTSVDSKADDVSKPDNTQADANGTEEKSDETTNGEEPEESSFLRAKNLFKNAEAKQMETKTESSTKTNNSNESTEEVATAPETESTPKEDTEGVGVNAEAKQSPVPSPTQKSLSSTDDSVSLTNQVSDVTDSSEADPAERDSPQIEDKPVFIIATKVEESMTASESVKEEVEVKADTQTDIVNDNQKEEEVVEEIKVSSVRSSFAEAARVFGGV